MKLAYIRLQSNTLRSAKKEIIESNMNTILQISGSYSEIQIFAHPYILIGLQNRTQAPKTLFNNVYCALREKKIKAHTSANKNTTSKRKAMWYFDNQAFNSKSQRLRLAPENIAGSTPCCTKRECSTKAYQHTSRLIRKARARAYPQHYKLKPSSREEEQRLLHDQPRHLEVRNMLGVSQTQGLESLPTCSHVANK